MRVLSGHIWGYVNLIFCEQQVIVPGFMIYFLHAGYFFLHFKKKFSQQWHTRLYGKWTFNRQPPFFHSTARWSHSKYFLIFNFYLLSLLFVLWYSLLYFVFVLLPQTWLLLQQRIHPEMSNLDCSNKVWRESIKDKVKSRLGRWFFLVFYLCNQDSDSNLIKSEPFVCDLDFLICKL